MNGLLNIRGKRKFGRAVLLAGLAFTAFMFTPRTIEYFAGLITFLGIIAKLYNDANVKANSHADK